MTDHYKLEVPNSCLFNLNLSFHRKDNNNCQKDNAEQNIYRNVVTYPFFNQYHYCFSESPEMNILLSQPETEITVTKRVAFFPGCLTPTWKVQEIVFPPNQNYSEKEIGLSYEGNVKNIELTAFAQPFRPGFNCILYLYATNIGNQLTEETSIKVTLPEGVQYTGGSDQIQVLSPNNLFIPVPNLKLGEQKTFVFLVKPNQNLLLNIFKKFIFDVDTLIAETDLEDNRLEIDLKTVGSFDPNDISVCPSPIISPRKQNLTYRIRFQNLGTYYAENVVIKDTLPEELDLQSFRPLGSSHNFNQSIVIKGRELTVKYQELFLPPAIWNWEKSNGFFEFSINKKPDLPLGSVISNSASIYFDYNEPVKTNTAEVEINIKKELLLKPLNIYPNPSSDYFQISPSVYNEIQVIDLMGRVVSNLSPDNLGRYQTKELPQGLYLIKSVGKTGRVFVN